MSEGSLNSEGILTLVPLPTKSLNLSPCKVNNLFKFSIQGRGLAPFVANVTKVKILSEIKQPLAEFYVGNSTYHPMTQEGITYGNYMIERQYQLHNLTL